MKESIEQLKKIARNVSIKKVELPDNENLNHIYLREGSSGIAKILESSNNVEEVTEVESVPLPIIPETPLPEENVIHLNRQEEIPANPEGDKFFQRTQKQLSEFMDEKNVLRQIPDNVDENIDLEKPSLNILTEHKVCMRGTLNDYYVLGTILQDLSSLRVTLMVKEISTGRKERTKLDLYEREEFILYANQLADLYNQSPQEIESDLRVLTDLLEKHREKQLEQIKTSYYQNKRYAPTITTEKRNACIQFLSEKNLLERIDALIEKTGVVGEENCRKLLFVIASTYKMNTPLHALVQGSSGSGKSHLINSIGSCFPPEDVINMTRVTSKSFYHYTKDELVDKLILIQDYDGLDEEAQFAFRELQTSGNISSSTTYKDRYGNLMSAVKTVRSHFASLLATTKGEVYYDNMSRSLITGVDESEEQTKHIMEHQNKFLTGKMDASEAKDTKTFLQNCMRCIKRMEVVNPYADKICLPFEAKMLRRLNSHYQAFVKQITILHQYQRSKDERGRLIAEPEDLRIACEIMFDAILLKVDDLDSSLRQFFDRMKIHIAALGKNESRTDTVFTQRDVRLTLNISKTQCFRYFEELEMLEYIQRTGGYANRGFKYKIVFWDDMEKVKTKIKAELSKQLEELHLPLAVLGGSSAMEHQNPHKQGD